MSETEWDDAAVNVGNFMGANTDGLTPGSQELPPGETLPQQAAPEPAQETPEPAQPERLRDPNTGQFTTEEKLYAGKFRTPEELETDYNQRLGSMTNELGQLRQQAQEYQELQQYLAYQQQQQQLQQQSPGAYSEEQLTQFDEWSMQNPHRAVEWARQSGNEALYERAIDNWYADDPKGASRYESAWSARAAMDYMGQQLAPMIQPMQQQHDQQALTSAYLATMQQHPDMNNYGEQLLSTLQQYPFLQEQLRSTDASVKAQALTAAYHIARSSAQAGPATAQAAPAQAGTPGLQAAIQATVASPSIVPADPGQMTRRQQAEQLLNDLWERGDDNG